MDLRLLRAFLAVAAHRNFGRAAGELSVTQPALTKQVQNLEAQVGGRLFRRGRHGAELTELGALLLPEAQSLVGHADALAQRVGRMARGEIGRLSVGFGLSSIELAPRAVAAFRRRYPDADITLEDMSSSEQLARLKTGELDVGFVRLPVGAGWGRLALSTDRLAVASADGGPPGRDVAPWAQGRRFVQLARVKGPGLVAQIEELCAAAGFRPGVVQEAHDLQTVLALVAAGVGAAFVPAGAAGIAPPSVSITPIDHPAAAWRVGAVWARDSGNPMTAGFLDVVRAERA